MVATRENFPLLAELLAEQQRLATPVAQFSSAHGAGSISSLVSRHSSLIPLSTPLPGEQYAFEVDLDSCTGCKSCVSACHSLNGLDDTETWRDVGLLVSPDRRHPFTQTVTTACHHCADPACLNGCPVLAYEKDALTGIVRHLDDQCIGCQYCILKCPYDAPKYNARLGIVRKCDMCQSRLAAGEAPACAQACPTHAIRIVTVPVAASVSDQTTSARPVAASVSERIRPAQPVAASVSGRNDPFQPVRPVATSVSEWINVSTAVPLAPARSHQALAAQSSRAFLPATPDPAYTLPTTRYVSRRPLPGHLAAGDAATLRPQPPHWPLAIMLTLLPVAVGLSVASAVLTLALVPSPAAFRDFVTYYVTKPLAAAGTSPPLFVTYYVTKTLGLAAWVTGALGLGASVFHLGQPRRAWRIFLGWRRSWLSREALVFGAWFGAATGAVVFSALAPASAALAPACAALGLASAALGLASATLGLAGLACSAMIYSDTRRRFWRAAQTFPRFFGTALVVALAITAPMAAAFVLLARLAWETRTHGDGSVSARLQRGPLRGAVVVRDVCGIVAIVSLLAGPNPLAFAALLAGELAERHLFFRAVDAPKMPGLPAGTPAKNEQAA